LKYGCAIASSADSRRAGLHTNNLYQSKHHTIENGPGLEIEKYINAYSLRGHCFTM